MSAVIGVANVSVASTRASCSTCNFREFCLPPGLSLKEIERLEGLISTRKRFKRGDALFRAGDKFESLYAVRLGFAKSTVTGRGGLEQVTGFPMAGDIVGFDGIATETHTSDVVTLEDTEVCVLPFSSVLDSSVGLPKMCAHFLRLLSREIVRQHSVMMTLGSMNAQQRIAAFLLDTSHRFEARGYSRTEFVLRMTRAEIGNYLGLKLETVSRVLSRFTHDGLIRVNQKHVLLMNIAGLVRIVEASETGRASERDL